jgi:AAA+ superfamily predicted ATPase
LTELFHALSRLDVLLADAVARAEAVYGGGTARDPFRGMRVDLAEVERLLAREPGAPLLSTSAASRRAAPLLDWLRDGADLSAFDLDILLVALAPELDLRYERLYAYLQDDVTRKRPTVDLVLNLLCTTAREKLAARDRLSASSPLVAGRIVRLVPPLDDPAAPFLAYAVKVDEQIAGWMLGNRGLDARIAPFCQLVRREVSLDELLLPAATREVLSRLAKRSGTAPERVRIYLRGLPGTGRRRAAEAVAGAGGVALLVADLGRARTETPFDEAVATLFRAARLHGVPLYLDGIDALRADGRETDLAWVLDALTRHSGGVFLAGSEPWAATVPSSTGDAAGIVELAFDVPAASLRRAAWESELGARGVGLDPDDLDALAARFRLTGGQIAEAAAVAAGMRDLAGRQRRAQRTADVFAAARAQTGYDLGKLAVKVDPVYGWDDIVLPDEVRTQLREIRSWIAHRERVMDEWGFDRKLSHGKGVSALFSGPPGTGKTMAAEIIGRDLGLDLYTIDLSGIVSKWIGETEKNLDRIFQAAEHGNAVLCFHEADAIFGKRSEVSDAHDRYANIEISYLLQKMETYHGLAVLTTNLPENIDEAFVRRLSFIVHFPFPEAAERRAIWERVWPGETPLADDVDFDALAHAFRLSGGNIKNAALAAAYLAAAAGDSVRIEHVLHAVRREFGKMGVALSEQELQISSGGDGEVLVEAGELA